MERHTLGNYTHPADPGEPTTGRYRVSVTDEERKVLAWLARGCRVLEVGTGLGVSTRALHSTAKFVVTVDPDPWVHENVWRRHLTADIDLRRELPEPGDYTHAFDLAFIDGDHEEGPAGADIDACMRLVRPGGLLVLHDCNYMGVRKACAARGLRPMVLPTAGHLGLVWRE